MSVKAIHPNSWKGSTAGSFRRYSVIYAPTAGGMLDTEVLIGGILWVLEDHLQIRKHCHQVCKTFTMSEHEVTTTCRHLTSYKIPVTLLSSHIGKLRDFVRSSPRVHAVLPSSPSSDVRVAQRLRTTLSSTEYYFEVSNSRALFFLLKHVRRLSHNSVEFPMLSG